MRKTRLMNPFGEFGRGRSLLLPQPPSLSSPSLSFFLSLSVSRSRSLSLPLSLSQKRKRSDGKVTTLPRRSVLSTISSVIREAVFRDPDQGTGTGSAIIQDPSAPASTPAPAASRRGSQFDYQLYQKTRSETFVEGDRLSYRSTGNGREADQDYEGRPDDVLEYQTSGYDIIAHLPPSTIQHTINFSSHRGGIAALGKNQQTAAAPDPYEEEVDVRNESWQCIPVPHLPKSRAHKYRLPMYPMLGPVVRCDLMTTRYSGITLDTASSSAAATTTVGTVTTAAAGAPPLASSSALSSSAGGRSAAAVAAASGYNPTDDSTSPSSPLDANASSISPLSGDLSVEMDRLVVLSSREDKDGGELRLFENFELIAVIRLSSVTKVPSPSCFSSLLSVTSLLLWSLGR
jgi:hypothetical protein